MRQHIKEQNKNDWDKQRNKTGFGENLRNKHTSRKTLKVRAVSVQGKAKENLLVEFRFLVCCYLSERQVSLFIGKSEGTNREGKI